MSLVILIRDISEIVRIYIGLAPEKGAILLTFVSVRTLLERELQ